MKGPTICRSVAGSARRTVKPLDPGQSITLASDVFADLVPGTGKVALSVTPTAALDVATLIAALDRYPLGCTEQIVSRALPLLYVNRLSAREALAPDEGIDERVRQSIERVLSRQDSAGSFGLWSPGGDDLWLDKRDSVWRNSHGAKRVHLLVSMNAEMNEDGTPVAELDADAANVVAPRDRIVELVGEDLVALYDKIRATSVTGAAPLRQRRCGGCQLELNPVELGRIKGLKSTQVRELIPNASQEAVHRDYFVLT